MGLAMEPHAHLPLHQLHLEQGARMVPFAGYMMPVQYRAGLLAEHAHTREKASLFDVSHMGLISVSGPDAAASLEQVLATDIMGLPVYRQRYALMLQHDGGILDDLMVARRRDDYLLIVNASRKQEDLQWLQSHIGHACTIQALSDQALLALQGPQSASVMQHMLAATTSLYFMQAMPWQSAAYQGYVMRSGYTGEDGFEIALPSHQAEGLVRDLLAHPHVQLAGLGARNSLRLEAGLSLYGQDMDTQTTPSMAGLAWSIPKVRRKEGLRAGGFIGAERVLQEIEGVRPVIRQRVGLHAVERIPVREGTTLHLPHGELVGHVTSGLLSPSTNRPIAMAYVAPASSACGTRINALVRGKSVPMEVVPLPFVGTRYRKN